MGLPSFSALRNKGFSNPGAILMSQSAVPNAVRQGKHGRTVTATEMVAITPGLAVKCSLRYAPSVEKTPRYHSNPVKVGRFIVAIAIIRSDPAGNTEV